MVPEVLSIPEAVRLVDESRAAMNIDSDGEGREEALAALLAAAGDPLRLRILFYLYGRGRSVAEICEELDAAQPRVSHHLSVLRRNGLLEVEVEGRRRVHRWSRLSAAGSHLQRARWRVQELLRRWLEGEGETVGMGSGGSSVSRPASPPAETIGDLEDYLL